ncbi:MAG: hypothetical protein IIC00_13260 [Planctomycetes bacterium]|nr:hypothetical protein [Planctomycetota bacterium]
MTRRIFCKVLLVVVAIFGLFVLSGVLSAQGRSQDAFDRVRDVQERNTEVLMAKPGVVGTAVGFNDDGEYAVLVLLEIPGVAGIPQELDGVPVQVVVTGKIYALSAKDRFPRPVPIGVSTGHPDITAGTIACRVTDGTDVYALSNNHVYANSNDGEKGVDNVLQPGAFDGGVDPADAIGTLFDFKEILFNGPDNTIDAAIALSSTAELGTATPSDGYGIPSSETVPAVLDLKVQKYGRTTELTTGKIIGINATVDVCYDGRGRVCFKWARFVNQIIIKPGDFSAGGDSGSLIVTQSGNNPVGLLFAGSSKVTIANRIDLVLDRFGVTVDGETPTPNDQPVVSITSPADGLTFDSGDIILFEGTANDTEDGDISASLVWTSNIDETISPIGKGDSFFTTLSDGNHTITASVTDSGDKTGSASVNITVGSPPTEPTSVTVTKPSGTDGYATEGGKNKDKHLLITVALVDDLGDPVAGASVSIDLFRDGSFAGSGTATTGSGGTVTFTLKNARTGKYTTEVTDVTAAGLDWDGKTPPNEYDKP